MNSSVAKLVGITEPAGLGGDGNAYQAPPIDPIQNQQLWIVEDRARLDHLMLILLL